MSEVTQETLNAAESSGEADESPILDPVRFKIKLDIGEDAYQFLKIKNNLSVLSDVIGAAGTGGAIASSSVVANTFFAGNGVLALLGIGTAATPIGWVVAAGLLSGGAYYGIQRTLNKAKNATVTTIPNYINTPLDLLAVGLSNLIFPLVTALARADNEYHERERRFLEQNFVEEWGYDSKFVNARLTYFDNNRSEVSVETIASELAAFLASNPDCNATSMIKCIVDLLRDVAKSDGEFHESEKIYIHYIESKLLESLKNSTSLTKVLPQKAGAAIKSSVKGIAEKIKSSTSKLRK